MAQSQRRKRIHRSRTEWSRLLSEFEASDTTQWSFCAERGLTLSNFCRWRKRLRTETPDDSHAGPLIELPPLPGLTSDPGDWRAELDLGGGIVLRLK